MRPDWIEVQWYVQNGTVSTSFDWSGKKRREAITVISYQLFITCVFYTIWKLNKAQPSKGGLVRGYDKPIHGSCASRTDAAGSIRQLMQQCHVVLKDHGCVMLLDKVGFTPLIPGISNWLDIHWHTGYKEVGYLGKSNEGLFTIMRTTCRIELTS